MPFQVAPRPYATQCAPFLAWRKCAGRSCNHRSNPTPVSFASTSDYIPVEEPRSFKLVNWRENRFSASKATAKVRILPVALSSVNRFSRLNLYVVLLQTSSESLVSFLLSSLDAITLATTVPSKTDASKNSSITENKRLILLPLNLNQPFLWSLSLIVDILAQAMSTIDDNTWWQ